MAPAVWALNMQLGQVLPYAECGGALATQRHASHRCVCLSPAVSGWVSWHAASRQPIGAFALRFMARLSGSLAGVFVFALLLQAIAGIVLTGCER